MICNANLKWPNDPKIECSFSSTLVEIVSIPARVSFRLSKITHFSIVIGGHYLNPDLAPSLSMALWDIVVGPHKHGSLTAMKPGSQKYLIRSISRIINDKGQRVMTAYLIHSLPLLMSAVQIFSGDQMAVVGHLVGLEQLGYEKDIGMTEAVSKTRFLTTTTPWPRKALCSGQKMYYDYCNVRHFPHF